MASEDADDWVQVRAFADPGAARMALDFLRHHDIEAETRGDSPEGVRQLYKEFDIRIVVRRRQLDEASEALEAMTSDASEGAPFRGPLPAPELEEGAAPAAELRNKRGAFAMVLAFLVPFGGGHFYAEHTQTGIVLACGTVVAIACMRSGVSALSYAWLTLVAVDAAASLLAIRRYRTRSVPSASRQRLLGVGLVATAFALAAVWDAA